MRLWTMTFGRKTKLVATAVQLALCAGAAALSGLPPRQRPQIAALSEPPSELGNCTGFECVQRYIDLHDPAFEWSEHPESTLSGVLRGTSWVGHVLRMTSQRWLRDEDTDHSLWTHAMLVVVPDTWNGSSPALHEWATMVVGGVAMMQTDLATGFSLGHYDVQSTIELAVRTGAPGVLLSLVPNQALHFFNDFAHQSRFEDAIKAYTWRHVLDHPEDSQWPIELPNAKAVVRGIDAAAAFFASHGQVVRRFGLTGCSKRANAAMMACAHDKRCALLVPCAMSSDLEDLVRKTSMSFGANLYIARDYTEHQVWSRMDTPEMSRLLSLVDSKQYLKKLTMPKLWLSSAQDDFFTLDHTAAFWSSLPSPKYLFVRENARHASSLMGFEAADFVEPVAAFIRATLSEAQLPQITWKFDEDVGELVVRLDEGPLPTKVSVWSASTCPSCPRRDFRKITADQDSACSLCGEPIQLSENTLACNISHSTAWASRPLDPSRSIWRVSAPAPKHGWTAYFVAVEFGAPTHMQVTSEAVVVPYGTYPFKACHGHECYLEGRAT